MPKWASFAGHVPCRNLVTVGHRFTHRPALGAVDKDSTRFDLESM